MCVSLGEGSFRRKPRDEEMDREREVGKGALFPREGQSDKDM